MYCATANVVYKVNVATSVPDNTYQFGVSGAVGMFLFLKKLYTPICKNFVYI